MCSTNQARGIAIPTTHSKKRLDLATQVLDISNPRTRDIRWRMCADFRYLRKKIPRKAVKNMLVDTIDSVSQWQWPVKHPVNSRTWTMPWTSWLLFDYLLLVVACWIWQMRHFRTQELINRQDLKKKPKTQRAQMPKATQQTKKPSQVMREVDLWAGLAFTVAWVKRKFAMRALSILCVVAMTKKNGLVI